MRRLALLALAAALAGCGGSDGGGPSVEVAVDLADRNGSGIFGDANVTRLDESNVRVDLTLEGALPEEELPAFIVLGGCAGFEPEVESELAPVEDGTSSTEVELSIDELTSGSYAIAVGSADPAEQVACGDLVP